MIGLEDLRSITVGKTDKKWFCVGCFLGWKRHEYHYLNPHPADMTPERLAAYLFGHDGRFEQGQLC